MAAKKRSVEKKSMPPEIPKSGPTSLLNSALFTGKEYSPLEKRLIELGYPIIGQEDFIREYSALRGILAVFELAYFALSGGGEKPRHYGYSIKVDRNIITDILIQQGVHTGAEYKKAHGIIEKEVAEHLYPSKATRWVGPAMFRADAVNLIKEVVPIAQGEFINYLKDTYGIEVKFKVSTPKKTGEGSLPYLVTFYLKLL